MTRLTIYNNATATQKTILLDFTSSVSAFIDDPNADKEKRYYFILKTGSNDSDGIGYPDRIVHSMSDLALNKTKRSISDSNVAYTTISDMVQDQVYDYIKGHTADQFSSGVSAKAELF